MKGLEERIVKRIHVTDKGCWEWTGARDRAGYGRMSRPGGRSTGTCFVHRFVYEVMVGDPTGLQVDHLCRNPPCCNPAHLEAVSPKVNTNRSTAAQKTRARYADHLFCPKGHPLFGANLYLYTTAEGWRNKQCRTCRRDNDRARRAAGLKR